MKKIIPILLVSTLLLSGLAVATEIETEAVHTEKTTLSFSEPRIAEGTTYTTISLAEQTTFTWETGHPMVPVLTQTYTYPFGTIIDDISVTYAGYSTQTINTPLRPATEPQIRTELSTETIQHQQVVSYDDITTYPAQPYVYHTGVGLQNHERVLFLTIALFPVTYTPETNTIATAEEATIEIAYAEPSQPIEFPDEYDLLIIAPADFASSAQRLVDHKIEKGITTKLSTLDEIPSTGVDEQESIKYYIKDAIENWGITYLILIGAGYEGEELFPNRYAYVPSGGYEAYFPSDLYYADIYDSTYGFSSWDADGDGKYAEYNSETDNDMSAVDIYPDVYMGRLVTNTPAELDIVIDKIIYYKEHNKMTNKIVQVGGDTFPGDPQKVNEGEFSNEAVLDVLPGYSTTQLWASNGQLTKQNIGKGYRSVPDFVDFSGHGSPQSWATHAPEDDHTWLPAETSLSPYTGWLYIDFDIFMVNNNQKYPVVFHNACSNNKYSKAKQSLSWKVLSKSGGGGIAAFGASGIGYGSYGTSEVDRLFGWMEVNTHEQMYSIKELGETWGNCITNYYNTFMGSLEDADYKTLIEYSMFGDPTVRIENGEDPQVYRFNQPVFNFFTQILYRYPRLQTFIQHLLS